jgi:glycerol-3-phosphate dehydrogenase
MKRDLSELTARTFDVLVVGGGIYGLTIACDAAQRGMSVALIERGDFGSGSSFNHLRTIHGGLRYLQTLDIGRARESIRERRTLGRIAPAAVRPLPFVLPLTRSLTKGRLAMRAGFVVDLIVARDRNAGVPASHYLPPGRVLPRGQALARFPSLAGSAFTGAAVWYDYVTTEPERLTLAWALAASGHGAVLANYLEGRELRVEAGRVVGVQAREVPAGRDFEIAARQVVNATGGSIDRLLAPLGLSASIPMLKTMNLVTRRPGADAAIGSRARSGRHLFAVPWRNRLLFGTWESAELRQPDDIGVREADVVSFLDDLNDTFPSLHLTRTDVTLVHRGIVPAAMLSGGGVALEGHEQIREHDAQGVTGLLSVAGTKYTTARGVAERVTDRLVARLSRGAVPCRTASTPLPWSPLTGDALLAGAAQNEMVTTLADAVIRRTALGGVGCPDEEVLAHAAAIVGGVLGWDDARRGAEIAAVRRFYE